MKILMMNISHFVALNVLLTLILISNIGLGQERSLTPESFLIREQFDVNDFEQIRKQGRPISKDSISNILHSLAVKAGLRKVNHNYYWKGKEASPFGSWLP